MQYCYCIERCCRQLFAFYFHDKGLCKVQRGFKIDFCLNVQQCPVEWSRLLWLTDREKSLRLSQSMRQTPEVQKAVDVANISVLFLTSWCLVLAHTLVNCPTRWSLLLIFGFLYWSWSCWQWQPHIGVCRLLWSLLRAGKAVFLAKCIFYIFFLLKTMERHHFLQFLTPQKHHFFKGVPNWPDFQILGFTGSYT